MPATVPVIRQITVADRQGGKEPSIGILRRGRGRASAGNQVLGEGLFKEAVVRERRRADRFDTSFAVLVVERAEASADPGSWVPILRAMTAIKRDIDAIGWLERGLVLGLLLPEASGRGASKVLHRLQREMGMRLGEAGLAALSIRPYAHGDLAGNGSGPLAEADMLLEAFVEDCGCPWRDVAKRALDIVGSLALLALFAPALLGVFAAVKFTSPGPVLFKQTRVGRRGQPFTMLKFRTMQVNADHGIHEEFVSWFIKSSARQPRTGNEVFKLTNDPRVTRVGRILRKTSLDELPQFWNVLRGEMSLVGPRPPLPFEVEQYQPWHRRRVLEAKPGITGPWQVNGRSRTTFDEMVRLDLRYARTYSLWTDIKILAATPLAMVSGKGAR